MARCAASVFGETLESLSVRCRTDGNLEVLRFEKLLLRIHTENL